MHTDLFPELALVPRLGSVADTIHELWESQLTHADAGRATRRRQFARILSLRLRLENDTGASTPAFG